MKPTPRPPEREPAGEVNSRSRILRTLLEHQGSFVAGSKLSKTAGISRAGVWKNISVLRDEGFTIDAGIRTGYRLRAVPDLLLPETLQAGLGTRCVGSVIRHFNVIDSTNSRAKHYAHEGVPDGTVVVAEKQTRGRGRFERRWIAPSRGNLLASVILYPKLASHAVFRMTMLVSVAIAKAVQSVCGVEAQIKWPNDIFAANKKLCGVLTEFMADYDNIAYVVVGFGINVNMTVKDVPEIRDTATSLRYLCERKVSRVALMKEILKNIDCSYCEKDYSDGDSLKRQWESRAVFLNSKVDILSDDTVTTGIARGINEDGHLLLEKENGEKTTIVCGDLSLRVRN